MPVIGKGAFMIRMTLAVAFLLAATTSVFADDVSKEVCLDSHSRGQDAREQNKLSLARKLFLTCAQPSCPNVVQSDCARMADDLGRLQPSLNFTARDGAGIDLADTSVYVDDILVATRLDDGKAHDVDPGKHSIRFTHAGKEQVLAVVVGLGERGRMVSVTFGAPPSPAVGALHRDDKPRTTHASGAKLLVGVGTALAVGGIALGVVGIARVPSNCSVGSHECAAAPGDPSFDDAASAMKLSNIGWAMTGIGIATAVGGAVWYVKSAKTSREEERRLVMPWVGPSSAGIAVSGRL
jgi:hypothetical protein